MFNVNPPLVRMVATLPLLFMKYETDWSRYSEDIRVRPERELSERFIELNGARSFTLLTMARLACLPFSLLGMWICWRWAGELFGDRAAVLSAILWCFSPNILGHGHLMTPDVACASLAAAAFYAFRHWLLSSTWPQTLLAGFAFGHAQATKTSCIILFGLWPLLWMFWRTSRREEPIRGMRTEAIQMATILLLGLLSINAWYGFDGTLTQLGNYQFLSTALGGDAAAVDRELPRNRFQGTWLGHFPIPLPRHYIQGIDRQKYHFERPDMSYLCGVWRESGWWHYYVYAALVKEPLGYWALAALAIVLRLAFVAYRTRWRNEVLLLVALVAFTLFISSQRGFNRHLRYLLPAFPYAFILVSRVARSVSCRDLLLAACVCVCTTWGIVSSLTVYPHSLGYFNEWAGGPKNGHNHLLASNTDWGQDLLYLKQWADDHPEAVPLHIFRDMDRIDINLAIKNAVEIPSEPTTGWYALSVNGLHLRDDQYSYFRDTSPVATAGYSLFIYNLSEESCRIIKLKLTTTSASPNRDNRSHAGQQ